MPVDLTPGRLDPGGASHFVSPAGHHHYLVIGLVNFMPVPAMRRTEQEFLALLKRSETGTNIRLRRFTFYDPGDPDAAAHCRALHYEPLDALWDSRVDGLIVTGAEPKAMSMAAEPLLPVLRDLVAWSGRNTKSAIFSCFAAHAAVWCLDQIARVRLPAKLSGVYDWEKCGDHPILADMPKIWRTPHSRHHSLDETELREAGYTILAHAPRLGADTFLKQHGDSQLMFWQGHPEYGPEVLLSEYCRDMRRFAAGVSTRLPNWPENYLEDVRRKLTAGLENGPDLGAEPSVVANIAALAPQGFDHCWRDPASRMATGWMRAMLREAQAGQETNL